MNKIKKQLSLSDNGKEICKLELLDSNLGSKVLDVSNLHKETGYFTFDPGFTSTASCESAITFVDGEKGQLFYRGYDIESLTKNCTYLEVSYLLLKGELPNQPELEEFVETITTHTLLHDQMQYFFRGFRRDAHPMAVLVGSVGALSAFYHDSLDISDPFHRWVSCVRLISKTPTLAACAYNYSRGRPFVSPRNDLDYSTNFLNMIFSSPANIHYKVNPLFAEALDKIFILHADHEQNASTSTVRLAGSSGANPFACIAAGISSLWGPAHGGANEAVLNMLEEIGTVDSIPKYINKAKDKKDPFRLMGFGHRVYTSYDPRAAVLKKYSKRILETIGLDDPMMKLANELERIALEDEYFVEKKLFPNVDFYSGIILKAIGFPTSMFTVLFSIARTVGWIAHWNEMISSADKKIGRPRQRYMGSQQRNFIKILDRK